MAHARTAVFPVLAISLFFLAAHLETYPSAAQIPSVAGDTLDLPAHEKLPADSTQAPLPVSEPVAESVTVQPATTSTPLAPARPDDADSLLPLHEFRPAGDTATLGLPTTAPFPEAQDSLALRFPYRPEFLSPAWDSAARALAANLAAQAAAAAPQGRGDPKGPVPVAKLPRPLDRPVRVLLHTQGGAMGVELRGEFGLARLDGAQAIPQAVVLGGKVTLKLRGRDLEIGDASGTRLLRNAPGIRLNPARMGAYFSLEGIPYRGSLDLLIDPVSAKIQAVNVLPMDEYLRGVLPYELGRVDAPLREALNALAVVARTYALKRMLRPAGSRFDLYDDVQDQVYKGMKDEYALSDAAVRDTRGQVLLYADTLVQAYYHSTCGGKTAARHEVWDGAPVPYLQSRDDRNAEGRPYCEASPMMRWQQSWSEDELVQVLQRNYAAGRAEGPKQFRSLNGFLVSETARCGRIKTLRIATDQGDLVLHGDRIRWAMKPLRSDGRILESARFEVNRDGKRITAAGSGFGHGVGLCQYGAMGRAKAGQAYREILSAYFAGTRVVEYR